MYFMYKSTYCLLARDFTIKVGSFFFDFDAPDLHTDLHTANGLKNAVKFAIVRNIVGARLGGATP